ncbi:MAG: hypothetical protein ABIH11_06865 [Candidatus Altiarchaeota archaeon]
MKGQMPDYRASTVMSDPETGKDRWTNIGVAFEGNETITVLMDAVPVNGKIILQRPKNIKKEE